VIVDPRADAEEPVSEVLERWAEDAEQVWREMRIRRASDGAEICVVATLASHGYGVPTALAVESVRARPDGDILRSGVYLRVDVERVLLRLDTDAAYELGEREREPASVRDPG
jgi:hypothetical protein